MAAFRGDKRMEEYPNTVRFRVRPGLKDKVDLKSFVERILCGPLSVKVNALHMIQEFVGVQCFIVTFVSEAESARVYDEWKRKKDEVVELGYVDLQPMYGGMDRVLVVHAFNPYPDMAVIEAYLAQFCDKVQKQNDIVNFIKVKTGKYRYVVRFKKSESAYGGYTYPPSAFDVAGERGYIYFSGQPKFCKKCQAYGHVVKDCEPDVVCRNCRQKGHMAFECPEGKKCHLCGSSEHLARECERNPRSYSDVAARRPGRMRFQSQMDAGFEGMDEREVVEEVARLEREDLRESVIKAASVVADENETTGSALVSAADNGTMAALEQREWVRRKAARGAAQDGGGSVGAPGLGAQFGSTGAPKATVRPAGSSSPPLAAGASVVVMAEVGGEEACLSPLVHGMGGGVVSAQSGLEEEGGGGEDVGGLLSADEEVGGAEHSPHLFSLGNGEGEDMEFSDAAEGGGAGGGRGVLSSSSDEGSELRVQSGGEQAMEASDSAESYVPARKESTRRQSGKPPGEGSGKNKKKKLI